MGLAEDIADLLTTGGVSTSIFVAELPASPIKALVVTPTAGMPTVFSVDGERQIERLRVQVRARATDFPTAQSLMASAHGILDGQRERLVNFRRYHWIEAVQQPFYLNEDDNEHPVVVCNYEVSRAAST